jgi:tetratricopeptide (TPR) repeat protein
MTNLRHVIAPLALGLILAGPAACKYTGDSESEQSPAPTKEAPASDEPTTPEESGELDSDDEQQEQSALGEGSDKQRELMARAKKAFLTEQIGRAEALFEELAGTEPVSGPQVSGVIALAQIYNETDRANEAIALYDSLADRVDEVAEIQLVIARAYDDLGESTRAINAYKRLLDIQPDYVFAWLELGKLYSGAGREEEATKALYTYEKRVYSLAKKLESADTKPAERIHILDVFSLVSDDRATEATVKALGADVPQIRQKAATTLGESGSAEAKKVLEYASINDPHLGVRMAAKDALKRLEKAGPADDGRLGPSFVDDEKQIPVE